METNELKAAAEGLLFASGDNGITTKQLAQVLNIPEQSVNDVLRTLQSDYDQPDRGMLLIQSHGVFHLTTKPEHSSYLQKLLDTPRTAKMSQAALETLAIIAYKQPITRTEIEDIRGVKSDRPVQTLMTRELIDEAGRKDGPGRPVLFSTTKEFLTYFGLTSLDELPSLPDEISTEETEQEADLFFEHFSEYSDENNHA